MIGKTLAHYVITSRLGKGGMGEVYQAKDKKLGRDVARKVLPEEFAKDADRVARFQREAKLLASLNHPNIASIYGLEESGGTNFLVLELVEGETLADQLKRGPIPVEDSLKLALQIAEALEAAHEKGVIHRDLKPANIKITPDGKAKVLDFGLAKAFAGEQAEMNLSNSPTLSDAATQQGVILGTAAYMSPEQARGEAVDKKADIWAFGCVLFEMLTGRATFEGRTVSDVLASVIKSEPGWNRLPPNLHPRIRLLLERCLEKEARNRYSSIGDARVDIQKVLGDPSGVFVQPVTTVEHRTKLRALLPWIATVVILSVITGAIVWKLRTPEPGRVMRFTYELPEGQQFSNPLVMFLAVSPDGSRFVYTTDKGLYLRSMDGLDARLIPGTDKTSTLPFFSPDGQWIGYSSTADRQLKKISISGGAPVVLCNVTALFGASWGADNTIVYSDLPNGFMRISANGGTPEPLSKSKPGMNEAPQILPDGKTVLYARATDFSGHAQILVQSLKSGERKVLFAGSMARYLPTGHLVYSLGDDIFAVPFDLDRLEAAGGPVSMVEGVLHVLSISAYAVSDSGTLVYVPTPAAAAPNQRTLVWVDRKGKEEPLTATANDYSGPRISPDGTRVALTVSSSGNKDIWIWDLLRKTLTRLTFDAADDTDPLWTPDGKRIAFCSNRKDRSPIFSDAYWKAADGTGEDEKLGSAPFEAIHPWSWSGDGKTLVLMMGPVLTGNFQGHAIGALSMEGDHKFRLLLQEEYTELQPKISPDGRWIAYPSNESGKPEIYVRPFPEVNKGKWQISTSGGGNPLWSPDGRKLFYRSGDSVMAVTVETEPTFKCGKPEVLFQDTYIRSSVANADPWDISPDGKRFLMMKAVQTTEKPPASEAPRKINIVLNWLEELKQRVPKK